MLLTVVVGDTAPALWVGIVVGLLIVVSQVRARRWHLDKISTRPGALVALGLLVWFGSKHANGALSGNRLVIYLLTLGAGVVLGATSSRSLHMWAHPLGIFVKGSPGTIALWVGGIGGACLVYGVCHIGFGGLVLFEGVTFLSQQLVTIFRGVRARPRLLGPSSAAPRSEAFATTMTNRTVTNGAVLPRTSPQAIENH